MLLEATCRRCHFIVEGWPCTQGHPGLRVLEKNEVAERHMCIFEEFMGEGLPFRGEVAAAL
jgi:hypothetical protein